MKHGQPVTLKECEAGGGVDTDPVEHENGKRTCRGGTHDGDEIQG